ncbi:hypothetical protein EON81_21780 [bacterium]|nr:MAG: hypothetical protein EON81_21780 [bacterium]
MPVLTAILVIAAQGQTPVSPPVPAQERNGPMIGDPLQPFMADHVYGPLGNRTRDFVSAYPNDPKVVAWVSDKEPALTAELAKELQAQVKAYAEFRLRALIVVLTEDKLSAAPRLRELGYRTNVKEVSLAVLEPTPEDLLRFNLAADSRLSIVVARGSTVTANIPTLGLKKIPTDALRLAIKEATQSPVPPVVPPVSGR